MGAYILINCYHLNALGIWLHNYGVLGASPDGLIRRPAAYGFCHQHPALSYSIHTYNIKPEILEIKCPFSAKVKTIPEAIESISEFCLGESEVGTLFHILFYYKVNIYLQTCTYLVSF